MAEWTETRVEWGVKHPAFGIDGPVIPMGSKDSSEALARRMTKSSGNLTLMRRTVHYSAWEEVPDGSKDSAPGAGAGAAPRARGL